MINLLTSSYQELESFTGIPSCNWSLYFNQKRNLSMRNLDRIAKAFGVEKHEALRLIQERQQKLLEKKIA